MYSDMCQWFSEWQKMATSPNTFPLDNWELDYVREDMWDEWIQLNQHIQRSENQIKKEKNILDCLLLSQKRWAEKLAPKFTQDQAQKFIESIRSIPQTNQHSAEWFKEKIRLLTASEFGYVVGTAPSARKTVYNKKFEKLTALAAIENGQGTGGDCFGSTSVPVGISSEKGTLIATVWGHRFEPIARELSSLILFDGHEILDGIGRIVHPQLVQLAASPDGLIISGPKAGNLIEIKCPISRTIEDDQIMNEYYCQTQIQMEVTGSPQVEFIEMKFCQSVFPPEDDYSGRWGVLCVVDSSSQMTDNNEKSFYNLRYEYGKHGKASENREEILKWQPPLTEGDTVVERMYWRLDNYHHKTIYRNPRWWESVGLPGYYKFWNEWDQEYTRWLGSKNYMFVDE